MPQKEPEKWNRKKKMVVEMDNASGKKYNLHN